MAYVIFHSGTPRHSGRFPWGSGKRPFQRLGGKAPKPHSGKSDDEMQSYIKRRNLERQYDKMYREANPSKLEAAKEIADKSYETANRIKNAIPQGNDSKSRMDLSSMTDKELRDAINRENLERQYNQMFNTDTTKTGKQYVTDALNVIGTVTGVTSSALGIALIAKQLKG